VRGACPLFDDAPEAAVVVVAVIQLAAAPRDDAPRATIACARGLHRVLAVVAALLLRQQRLAVAEDDAIARVREWAMLLDEGKGVTSRGGQILETNVLLEGEGRKRDQREKRKTPLHDCAGFLSRMCSSRSCFSVTCVGAPVSRSWPRCVFGKAITSRIASAPAISVTSRSKPNAMPPCGGAPYCSASSRKPNFARCWSGLIFSAS